MGKELLRVLVFRPNEKYPRIEYIDGSLKSKQELVDGYIEIVPMRYRNGGGVLTYTCVCNEEGKLRNLPPCGLWANTFDPIVGTAFLCKYTDFGDMLGLSDEDIAFLRRHYNIAE